MEASIDAYVKLKTESGGRSQKVRYAGHGRKRTQKRSAHLRSYNSAELRRTLPKEVLSAKSYVYEICTNCACIFTNCTENLTKFKTL